MATEMKKKGVVDAWHETGTEGVCWIFQENGKKEPYAFHVIREGDRLTIYNEDGSTAFEGEIIPDYKAGWKHYPRSRKRGQPCALGYWIHWTQKGWKPDDWARLFIRKKNQPPLKAELIKKENNKRP